MGIPPQQIATTQAPPAPHLPPAGGMHQMPPSAVSQQLPQAAPPGVPVPNPPPGMNMPMVGMPPPGLTQPITQNQTMPGPALPTHVLSAPNIAMQNQSMPHPVMQTPSHPAVTVLSTQHMPANNMQQQFQPVADNYGTVPMNVHPQQQNNESSSVAELISFD